MGQKRGGSSRGVEKLGNRISRARVADKMAGTLRAFGARESEGGMAAVGGVVG